jgi:dephospho-CoA kinase
VKPPDLYLIGLTGNIACGKSTVVAMLQELGAATMDADQVTRRLQEPGTEVYHQIVEAFGAEILTSPGGPIDRARLGAIVFNDAQQLQRLEQIVHPAVHTTLTTWLADVSNSMQAAGLHAPPDTPSARCPVAVIDAIKLLEAGWKAHCDSIWVVIAPEEQQIERLMTTRGMHEAEARQRIHAQPPQASRLPHADVVIDNGGTRAQTRAQVVAAWKRLVAC